MKKFALVSVFLALCIMLSACGSASNSSLKLKGEVAMESESGYGYASDNFVYTDTADGSINFSTQESANGSMAQIQNREEKLVYTSRVTLETEDFEAANTSLHNTIKELGGIIITENAYNLNSKASSGMRTIDLTVRIPQEHYDRFLSGMSESYNVARVENSVDNLTDYYYDNANRLRSYRVQEERLFAMLEKAETVEEMLKIEDRLCDVQYQIESLTNTQNTIDNDVKYSTFYLNLREVTKFTTPAPKTFGDRLGDTLQSSGEAFAEFSEGLLFTLIFIAPYLVIFAVIIIICVVVIKNKKRAENKKAAAEEGKNEK